MKTIMHLAFGFVRLMPAVAVWCACLAASADTVAWWRFCDLGPDGGKATAETTFTNLVDATKYPALARSFSGLTVGTDPDYMPSTINPFSSYEALRVFDPVSGKEHETAMALHCPWGGDKSALSGGAVVKSDPMLYGHGEGQTGDFTFECFFRTTAEGLARSDKMQCLGGQKSNVDYAGAWMLMIYNKTMWIRCTIEDENGDSFSALSANGQTVVTPDEWHHAAVTFESATGKFRVYLDYKQETSYTFNKKSYIRTGGKNDILIGKGPEGTESTPDRSLDGDIAEARISDSCLTPDQFLSFKEPLWRGDRASVDPDTLLWLSFDSTDSFNENIYGPFLTANPKLTTASVSLGYGVQFVNGEGPSHVTTDVAYCERIRQAAVTAASAANAGSLQFSTNGLDAADSAYVKVMDPKTTISAGSFTQEMFFKVDHPCVVGQKVTAYSYGLMCSQALKVLINQSNNQPLCRFKTPSGDFDVTTAKSVNDGAWHHVAVVYDAERQTGSFYVDYRHVETVSGIVLKNNVDDGNVPCIIGGARENNTIQVFDGWIDEFRITRRPLAVSEFLVRDGGEPDGMVAWLHYDKSMSLAPWGDLIKSETAAILEEGGRPAKLTDEPRAAVITDFAGNVLCPANTGSLSLDGSAAWYGATEALDLEEFTVEFFFRPRERFAAWAGPVAYNVTGLSNLGLAGYPYDIKAGWMIGGVGAWDNFQYRLAVVTTNRVTGGATILTEKNFGPVFKATGARVGNWVPANFDGKWHHVALTFKPNAEKTETTIKTYWDYELQFEESVKGTVSYEGNVRPTLKLGAARSDRTVCGDVDELRIMDHALDEQEFMRKAKVIGTLLLVR